MFRQVSASCFPPTKPHSDAVQQGSNTQHQPSLTGEASVPFESIRKEQFDRFRPPDLGLESLMVWQMEWFANKAGTTIGTLALCKADKGWNYAVLRRDQTGDFQVHKLGGDAFSLDDARSDFLLEMGAAEKSSLETCPERG
jgi:hypothetical protein